MIKLKENASKIFLDEFGVGEIQLKPVDNSLSYVWLPIEVFIDRYLNDSKYSYTRILAQDNLAGIRLYLYDDREEKYNFVFSTKDTNISVQDEYFDTYRILSNNLPNYYDCNPKRNFQHILEYFETLYYDYSQQLTSVSLFIEDVMHQFECHMLESVDKFYKDIINCIVDFGDIEKIRNLFASIKDEFIEEYEDEPEFVDIENDYDILVEIINEFFCNIEEEYDEIYLEKENGEKIPYLELINEIFLNDPVASLGRIEDILDEEYDGNVSLRDTMCIFDVLDSFITYSEDLLVDKIKELEREE